MEVIAKTSVRVAPRKVRLVADAIRKLSVEQALRSLTVIKNRGSVSLEKTLRSAIANAINNNKLKQELLTIKSIDVSESPSYKRFHPSTRGRVHPYKRRGSNIKIVLTDNKSETNDNKQLVMKGDTNS
nr:50S ribosomal protein L22 [Candidatus Levybacteria bacterium]